MGKLFSKANKDGALSKASTYFQSFEISELDELFEKLTKEAESHGKGKDGIDKETFSTYFPYPGVLRDQIFGVFDVDGDGWPVGFPQSTVSD